MTITDRRRETWRSAQQARRMRMQAKGKALLRLWCTPEEAERIKEALQQWRRIERFQRFQQLQRRAKQCR